MSPEELIKALNECNRCGRCMSVCPVYRQTSWEGSVARGKLALLRAELTGSANLERNMKDLLSHCLQCGACAEQCANSVRGDELIQAGRVLALEGGGLAKLKSLLVRDVMSRGPVTQGLWKARGLFLKNVPPESGLHFRFPTPGLDRRRWLPALASTPFLSDLREISNKKATGPRVALFVGCVANFMRTESARAAVRILEAAGARIVIPRNQVCCGKPAYGAGDQDAALHAARANLAAFNPAEFDYVTAFCATCSEHLRHYARIPELGAAGMWPEKVRDFNDLLVNVLNWRPTPDESSATGTPLRVFYHDPCHLRRKQGVHQEPRALIRALSGVELVGADEPPVCCGYGGIFNLWHYDLSRDIFRVRAETIVPYKPEMVVTTCSGCLLQFEDGTRRLGQPFRVSSLVELLADRGLSGSDV